MSSVTDWKDDHSSGGGGGGGGVGTGGVPNRHHAPISSPLFNTKPPIPHATNLLSPNLLNGSGGLARYGASPYNLLPVGIGIANSLTSPSKPQQQTISHTTSLVHRSLSNSQQSRGARGEAMMPVSPQNPMFSPAGVGVSSAQHGTMNFLSTQTTGAHHSHSHHTALSGLSALSARSTLLGPNTLRSNKPLSFSGGPAPVPVPVPTPLAPVAPVPPVAAASGVLAADDPNNTSVDSTATGSERGLDESGDADLDAGGGGDDSTADDPSTKRRKLSPGDADALGELAALAHTTGRGKGKGLTVGGKAPARSTVGGKRGPPSAHTAAAAATAHAATDSDHPTASTLKRKHSSTAAATKANPKGKSAARRGGRGKKGTKSGGEDMTIDSDALTQEPPTPAPPPRPSDPNTESNLVSVTVGGGGSFGMSSRIASAAGSNAIVTVSQPFAHLSASGAAAAAAAVNASRYPSSVAVGTATSSGGAPRPSAATADVGEDEEPVDWDAAETDEDEAEGFGTGKRASKYGGFRSGVDGDYEDMSSSDDGTNRKKKKAGGRGRGRGGRGKAGSNAGGRGGAASAGAAAAAAPKKSKGKGAGSDDEEDASSEEADTPTGAAGGAGGAAATAPVKKSRARDRSKSQKGLRHFSLKVCEKVELQKNTSYNRVADDLVKDLTNPATAGIGKKTYDEKNIRRRVYDALNVLMALVMSTALFLLVL